MGSIWGFLLQTLSVSVVAAVILILKWLLQDKLSPRWQYGVWIILVLRVLLPARVNRSLIYWIPLSVEMLKGMVESGTKIYTPVYMKHVIPWITEKPASATEWIFAVYAAGVVAWLIWYFVSYCRLRRVLAKGMPAEGIAGDGATDGIRLAEINVKVHEICAQIGIKPCRVVEVDGIDSAFICGVFNPVMAVPSRKDIDYKIIMHEMMHLKYKDTLQSVGWCVLRALHWCNPFMHYVFDRIGNDMESLCDQRVLEQLEGEERRAYGMILLEMANEKYARSPGTSSISNGGKNIKRRIEAIVRFKKYPKGMALVSVCIVLVLLVPCLVGTDRSYAESLLMPMRGKDLTRSMAMARVVRCETMAGAIDTYAKGLMLQNGVYIAIASPVETHEELTEYLLAENKRQMAATYKFGDEYGVIEQYFGYDIFNISDNGDGSYNAQLAFYIVGWSDLGSQSEPVLYPLGGSGETEGFYAKWKKGEQSPGNYIEEYAVIVPIKIYKDANEGGGWVVEENGKRAISGCNMGIMNNPYTSFPMNYEFGRDLMYNGTPLPWRNVITETGENGTLNLGVKSLYHIDNYVKAENAVNDIFFAGSFDTTLKPDAVFSEYMESTYVSYDFGDAYQGTDKEPPPTATVRIIAADGLKDAQKIEFSDQSAEPGSSAGGTSDQVWTNTWADGNWNGNILTGMDYQDTHTRTGMASYNNGYKIEILWDGETIDEYLLEEVG